MFFLVEAISLLLFLALSKPFVNTHASFDSGRYHKKGVFYRTFVENIQSSPRLLRIFNVSQIPEDAFETFYSVTLDVDKSLHSPYARNNAKKVGRAAACKVNNIPTKLFAGIVAKTHLKLLESLDFLTSENAEKLALRFVKSLKDNNSLNPASNPYSNLLVIYVSGVNVYKDMDLMNNHTLNDITEIFANEFDSLPDNCKVNDHKLDSEEDS